MVLFPEVRRFSVEELKQYFKAVRVREVDEDEKELWLEEVALRIAQTGTTGIAFLLSCIPKADEPHVRAALLAMSFPSRRKLSNRNRTRICEQARMLLRDGRALVVAEAVDALTRLQCEVNVKWIFQLLDHPSPYVVGSALRFFARRFGEQVAPMLEDALAADEPIVRQNAIDELDELGWKPSLPKIRALLNDPDTDVRLAAKTAVENLGASARRALST